MLLLGCAQRVAYTPADLNMKLGSGNVVQKTDNFIVLYDLSASMNQRLGMTTRQTTADSTTRGIAETIPNIKLTSGLRTFWGRNKEVTTELVYGMVSFNKSDFLQSLNGLQSQTPEGRTPLGGAIQAASDDLNALPGNSAVIIVSDFEEMIGVDDIRPANVIEATTLAKAKYGDRICFYTVQIGKAPPPGGETLAVDIVKTGKCGVGVNAEDINTPASISDFVEKIFLSTQQGPVSKGEQAQPPEKAAESEMKAAPAAGAEATATIAEDIHFDFDKYVLNPVAKGELDKLANYMKENSDATVVIEGNCDERGTAEYNLALGQRRAASAEKYLVAKGIEKKRIKTVSYGKDRPLDPGHNEEAWAKNRRDHFEVNMK
jgi:OOP family OmpA-OmpF porin